MDLRPLYRSMYPIFLVFLLYIMIQPCRTTSLVSLSKPDLPQSISRTSLCSTGPCESCAAACPSASELAKNDASCREGMAALRRSSLNNAYINCTKQSCDNLQRKNACGLIDVDSRVTVTSQVDKEVKRTWAQVRSIQTQRKKFDESNSISPALSLYYERALSKIQECKARFRSALGARARNVKLKEYLKSLEYRKISQEVTRYRFQNDELRRHLKFWEKQYRTLSLAVRTSPEGLKDARDALLFEMQAYEADATRISVLQNSTLSKEERAELVIKLKQGVHAEIEATRTQYAHLLREEQFINGAGEEIYNMLRDVLLKLGSGRIAVRCGGGMLSDIVGNAISFTKN